MSRYFENISFEQFKKDIKDDKKLYEEYLLPKRSTKNSAGYDFFAIEDFVISPGEVKKIPTGYRAKFEEDEVLFLVVRSSMGFKHNVRMTNQVGVIDSDFYSNLKNNGHMFVSLQNHGDKEYVVKKGEAYCQGIFMKYLTVDNEEKIDKERTGWSSLGKSGDLDE